MIWEEKRMAKNDGKGYGCGKFLLDVFLVCITCGIYGAYLILKFIRRNS